MPHPCIGTERMGAALDVLLAQYGNNDPTTPSVLRLWLLRKAKVL